MNPAQQAAVADVVLPVPQWAEEEGTMTSLEGRVLRRRRTTPIPASPSSPVPIRAHVPGSGIREYRAMTVDGAPPAASFGIPQFFFNFNFVYAAEHYITSGLVAMVFAMLLLPNSALAWLFLDPAINRWAQQDNQWAPQSVRTSLAATREVVLTIHWRGGQHSQLRVRKPKTGEHGCQTPEAALAVMARMATRFSDADIAATFGGCTGSRPALRCGRSRTC